MPKGELAFVEWLRAVCKADTTRVPIPIGDDMAGVHLDGRLAMLTADMLLDGVHFETARHTLRQIGYKAIACSLSDCAAMACRPRGALVSVALPGTMSMEDAQGLYSGMLEACGKFHCPIVGGDTTSWRHPLAIDVAMLGEPMSDRGPVRRDGARPGDVLLVTGQLGGSLLGKHLAFTPRLAEAEFLAVGLSGHLHAMIDITDGLALDTYRMCQASGCAAILEEDRLDLVAAGRAREAARQDGRSPLDHVLHDGEDFELLAAVHPDALGLLSRSPRPLLVVGRVVKHEQAPWLHLRRLNGRLEPLPPGGYEHFR